MEPNDVIELVKASGLRGRGGAGFPDRPEVAVRRQDTPLPKYIAATPTRASRARSRTTS